MNIKKTIKIGTRSSPLALIQANEVKSALQSKFADFQQTNAIEIVKLVTQGDVNQVQPIYEIGGKGVFSKEIDKSLFRGEIDIAVHSLKDLETTLPGGIILGAVLEREDVRDAMLFKTSASCSSLPKGSVVGTSSPRRRAQILNVYPHLKCVSIRGNIQTRLKKLENGGFDSILLAMAGLNRLKIEGAYREVIEPEVMLPAVGQGTIAVTCLEANNEIVRLVGSINHKETMTRIKCERAMLAALGGSCHTPVGGLAIVIGGKEIWIRGALFKPNGKEVYTVSHKGPIKEHERIGLDAGTELGLLAGPDFINDL